jgi:hypothetical protein
MRNPVICILLTSLAAAIPGCINAEPSTFPVDAGPQRPDVVRDTADDADPHAACRACLEAPEDPGPGCAGAVAACMADPKAAYIYECGFRHDCWSLPAQADIVNCGFPCFTEAGITSFGDPAITLTTAVLMCVLGGCQPVCGANP